MQRYLSSKRSSRSSRRQELTEKERFADNTSTQDGDHGDADSTAALLNAVPPPVPNLKVKRVDFYYSNWTKSWKYRSSSSKVTPEMIRPMGNGVNDSDPWQSYCFVVVRKMPRDQQLEPTFQVVVKSPYLLTACKDVIQQVPGLSWTSEPVELDPQLLLTFYPQFEEYQRRLKDKKNLSTEEGHVLISLGVLLDYLRKDYHGTLTRIANLTSHGEITFDLLYAILVPRSILITECPITGELRAVQLKSVSKVSIGGGGLYDLICESVDAVDAVDENTPLFDTINAELRKAGGGKSYGRVENRIVLPSFKGTVKINSLDTYPLKYHPAHVELKKELLARGRKWISLRGIHHMNYKGTAALMMNMGTCKKAVKYSINSRIMVDRANFKQFNPNYDLPITKVEAPDMHQRDDMAPTPVTIDPNSHIPTLRVRSKTPGEDMLELTDDELILTSPVVYGFSLSDKIWLEFNVKHVLPIVWNDEAFANLVLPGDRKVLLQSLVEAHNADLGFDDFVQGKGHGLVINLFGPPGVGKTLSAEATSEHVRRPLYVVGGGDLGTQAAEVDQELERVLEIATIWKAIVLIDEADVFLEQRSSHDLERNAMVAIFLRHVEYYRGILFLTTNRVKTFDEAFLSRIHVALHFQELSKSAKVQVWRAFLQKVGAQMEDFNEELLEKLASRDINGRQIKNATRTANSLAVSRHEKLGFVHLVETLDAMDEFAAEFTSMTRSK
ncbi:hypothetical protein AcV5_009616 [Taiwanofungus camphoratus]|nr:hypothetical protein AcV5_009616 [Antrodia cinnamomea]KAI0942945.1 hypothetical protein AcV7_002226 [Antrodia cinnamomea]